MPSGSQAGTGGPNGDGGAASRAVSRKNDGVFLVRRYNEGAGPDQDTGRLTSPLSRRRPMEPHSARVTNVDAIQAFRGALLEFGHEVSDSLSILMWEVRKVVEWIEHDRSQYWPAQVRQASDALVQARTDLERCEMAIRPDDRSPCTEQKKALERAKGRLRYCEQKVEAVRHWKRTLQHEINEFQGRLGKLSNFLETDVPRGVAVLERILQALDRYTQAGALPGLPPEPPPSESSILGGTRPSGT